MKLAIRQDGKSGRIYFSSPSDRKSIDMSRALYGSESKPQGAAVLTQALSRIGMPGNDAPSKKNVEDVLKSAGRTRSVTAVVELKRPMKADEIRRGGYLHFANALFSPAKGKVPIYWDSKSPMFCHNCDSDSFSITRTFRSWVASLRPEDDFLLQQFGLSLDRVSKVARAGNIYGYVEVDANPILLGRLLSKSHVKTMYIVNIKENCEDYGIGPCEPSLWPRSTQLNGIPYAKLD
ncbi:hypothetical protein ACGFIV_21985 [Sphaerisporangium sp. NPDC049003]|uniref:hypothetical protein n=1 Tax=Sphaerisporangium sp. NPDC049003 TaxID=3364517 RepID=UPI00371067C7